MCAWACIWPHVPSYSFLSFLSLLLLPLFPICFLKSKCNEMSNPSWAEWSKAKRQVLGARGQSCSEECFPLQSLLFQGQNFAGHLAQSLSTSWDLLMNFSAPKRQKLSCSFLSVWTWKPACTDSSKEGSPAPFSQPRCLKLGRPLPSKERAQKQPRLNFRSNSPK
jgi:hypothetical protein